MAFGDSYCDMPAPGMAKQCHRPDFQRANESGDVGDMRVDAEVPPSVGQLSGQQWRMDSAMT